MVTALACCRLKCAPQMNRLADQDFVCDEVVLSPLYVDRVDGQQHCAIYII